MLPTVSVASRLPHEAVVLKCLRSPKQRDCPAGYRGIHSLWAKLLSGRIARSRRSVSEGCGARGPPPFERLPKACAVAASKERSIPMNRRAMLFYCGADGIALGLAES